MEGGVAGWLAGRVSRLYSTVSGVLEAWRRLRSVIEGREVAELAGEQHVIEMLLGGFDPESSDPYRPGSLARLYRDLYGFQVLLPRRLALRLRDGLPLSVAGRGVRVAVEDTVFTGLLEAVRATAKAVLEGLGAEPSPPVSIDTGDPLWGLGAAARVAEDALSLLPPYSREALVLFSASSPSPEGVVEALAGGREVLGELERLGYRVAARLSGHEAPGIGGGLRRLARVSGVLLSYRCLALLLMRLLQLRELRSYIEAPDPLKELLEQGVGEARGEAVEALVSAAEHHGEPRLPAPENCREDYAPVLPADYAVYRGRLVVRDVEAYTASGKPVGTFGELVSGIAPLLYRGLAGLEPTTGGGEEGGGEVVVYYWLTAPRTR